MHISREVALFTHGTGAMVAVKAHWITTATAIVAFFTAQTMSQNDLLGRADRIVEVITTSTGAIKMIHVTVAFAADVRLLVQLLDGVG